jgi:glycosyltransferase involved in cell wall biosynthesis
MTELSVLIPTWNAAGSIRRALDSVLAEHSIDLEVVVVDDGSRDATKEVVAAIAAADPRVVLLALPENGGVSNARNRGLEVVRGEWLTLLDADDRFLPGGLAALHRAAVATDALAVVGQQVWSDGRSTWMGPLYDIPDIRRPGRKSLASAPGILYYVSPHAKLFRRGIVEDLRFEGRVLGDQPWIVRGLLRAGDRIEVIGDTVYEWIRSAPAGSGPSITAATRASTRRGIEATEVAVGALAAVQAEAERSLADPAERVIVAAAYVERLLRSDLAAHLERALHRRDPTIGDLFEALATFVGRVPPALLASSDALARDIVTPPLARWSRVDRAARPAFWMLAAAAIRAQPDLVRHADGALGRLALGRVLARPGSDPDPRTRAALAIARLMDVLAATPRLGRAALRRVRSRLPG